MNFYTKTQKANHLFVSNLINKFGRDTIFVIGDYSMPNIKHQKAAKGVGLLRLMRKTGFEGFRINEYKTSSHCPSCTAKVGTFMNVPNPRPYQRKKRPIVRCHGLLECRCGKKYNRDLLATLNFKSIVDHVRDHGVRPLLFRRGEPN
jgi:hypothetical protein